MYVISPANMMYDKLEKATGIDRRYLKGRKIIGIFTRQFIKDASKKVRQRKVQDRQR